MLAHRGALGSIHFCLFSRFSDTGVWFGARRAEQRRADWSYLVVPAGQNSDVCLLVSCGGACRAAHGTGSGSVGNIGSVVLRGPPDLTADAYIFCFREGKNAIGKFN